MPPAASVRDKPKYSLNLGGYFKVIAFVSTMVHLSWSGKTHWAPGYAYFS